MPIRPPTHRASGHARRDALLEAAIEVIADAGIGGATHRAIAARGGMPLSTTSYFFASLDDLIAAALQVVADRFVTRVEARVEAVIRADLGPDQALDQFVDMLLNSPHNHVVAQFEIYLECARRPALQASAHQIMASLERGAVAALRALGVAAPEQRAPMVVAMVDGFALHRRAWPRGDTDRRVLRDSLGTLVAGYLAADSVTA